MLDRNYSGFKKIGQVVHFNKKFSQVFENWYTTLVNAAITGLEI
jgi:hypothetical protein